MTSLTDTIGPFGKFVRRIRSISFMPTNDRFFELFQKQIEEIKLSSEYLLELMNGSDQAKSLQKKIKASESRGDDILREIGKLTNESITTPFPRQDILNLARLLDDVLDGIEGTADNFIYYQISEFHPSYLKMSVIIDDGAELLTRVILSLEKFEHPMDIYAKMRELEHRADDINNIVIPETYLAANNATDFDKFKTAWIKAIATDKIITKMEKTADALRHVTDTIEGVIAKGV